MNSNSVAAIPAVLESQLYTELEYMDGYDSVAGGGGSVDFNASSHAQNNNTSFNVCVVASTMGTGAVSNHQGPKTNHPSTQTQSLQGTLPSYL
mmetsp:Transcript_20652/g.35232  ORF Transcript_20652/g.35232 Transcript_20652/m.35232 type:complete len:93 (+) Transcript_20652:160-438(+)